MKKNTLVFLMFLMVACSSRVIPTNEPTIALLSTQTPTITVVSPTMTNTPVHLETLPPATWTALPTFNPDEGAQILRTWLHGTSDCYLPCWAGITPGKTQWDMALHSLQPLEGIAKLRLALNDDCIFGKCNWISWSLLNLADGHGYIDGKYQENTVNFIQLEISESDLVKSLSLEYVLRQYGKPALLFFSTEPDLPGELFLELILVYPDQQFVIKYSKYAKLINNEVVSCGQDSYFELIILDNKEQLTSVDTLANAVETEHFHVDVWHKSVEESLGMNIDTFYETFSKENAPCITTPINVWQP